MTWVYVLIGLTGINIALSLMVLNFMPKLADALKANAEAMIALQALLGQLSSTTLETRVIMEGLSESARKAQARAGKMH